MKARETWKEIADRTTKSKYPNLVLVLGTIFINSAETANSSGNAFDKLLKEKAETS